MNQWADEIVPAGVAQTGENVRWILLSFCFTIEDIWNMSFTILETYRRLKRPHVFGPSCLVSPNFLLANMFHRMLLSIGASTGTVMGLELTNWRGLA